MKSSRRSGLLVPLCVAISIVTCGPGPAASDGDGSPEVGWMLDLADPALPEKITDAYLWDATAMTQSAQECSLAVKDGVLRITGNFGKDGVNRNDYVHIMIPVSGGIDLTRYPVFEVEWRSDGPLPAATLLINVRSQTSSGEDATAYYYPQQPSKPGEWVTAVNEYVPDAGYPTRGTPVKLNSWELHTYVHGTTGEFTFEIRSMGARALNAEESAAAAPRMELLRNFRNIPVPEPWASQVFPFGFCASCRGPEGYESWYDNVVRHHGNLNIFQMSQGPDWKGFSAMATVEEFIAARRKELASAAPRGLYILPAVGLSGIMHGRGPEGLPWLHEYAGAMADAFREQPYLAGWFVADECSDDWLWGVAAAKNALDKADPFKLNMMNHFEINRILRFEPYLNVVMTDYYPIVADKRDPWAIGPWCRTLDGRSDRPQWIFLPAFGEAEWWRCAGSYQYPTRAETRLVGYLALANGVKGISYFAYSFPNSSLPDFAGVFSALGHALPLDDPIAQDISSIGEKLAEIGPFLLRTELLPKDAAKAIGSEGADRPLSVGVRQLEDGSALIVVVNESIEESQAGEVRLSRELTDKNNRVHDLYELREIPMTGDSFAVNSLIPGDGRIYFLGTRPQFGAVKKAILANRAKEILRLANLDLLVARRWGVDVSTVDDQFEVARAAAARGDIRPAEKALEMVIAMGEGKSEFAQTRALFLETKEVLGRVFYAIHAGRIYSGAGHIAWPGNEELLGQPVLLWDRFGPLQEDYFLGGRERLADKFRGILKEANDLLDKAHKNTQQE